MKICDTKKNERRQNGTKAAGRSRPILIQLNYCSPAPHGKYTLSFSNYSLGHGSKPRRPIRSTAIGAPTVELAELLSAQMLRQSKLLTVAREACKSPQAPFRDMSVHHQCILNTKCTMALQQSKRTFSFAALWPLLFLKNQPSKL